VKKRGSSNNSLQCVTVISLSCSIKVSSNSVTFEMNKIHKNYTLLLIGVEGYSTPVGKLSANAATKRVAWNGNHPLKSHTIHRDILANFVFS